MPGTRKLGRTTAHRNAMLRGMVTLLLENGQIETTLQRAKEVRSMAEKMITLGKKNTLATRRAALAYITKEDVVTKLFSEIAPKYEDRNGGYTQIFKLGNRRGDAAEMAIVRLIGSEAVAAVATEEKKETAPKKTAAPKKAADANKEAAPKKTTTAAPKKTTTAAPKKTASTTAKKTTAPKKAAAPKADSASEKAAPKKTTTKKAATKADTAEKAD